MMTIVRNVCGMLFIAASLMAGTARAQQQQPKPKPQPAPKSQPTPPPTKKKDCSLEIRGLRLGMTLEQVRALLPGLDRDPLATVPDKYGFIKTVVVLPHVPGPNAKFEGIRSVGLQFLDKQLTYVILFYDKEVVFKDADEFAAKVSTSLALPKEWKTPPLAQYERYQECENYRITVETGGEMLTNMVVLDSSVEKKLKERKEKEEARAKEEEKKQQAKDFKP